MYPPFPRYVSVIIYFIHLLIEIKERAHIHIQVLMDDPFTFPISCPKLAPRSVGIAILIYFLSLRALCNKPAFYGRRILGRKPGWFPGSFLYDAHAARIYIVETCLRQLCIGPLCFNCSRRNPRTIVRGIRAERDIFILTRARKCKRRLLFWDLNIFVSRCCEV